MLMISSSVFQLPLFQIVESDDLALPQHEDLVWFEMLRDFDYQPYYQLSPLE